MNILELRKQLVIFLETKATRVYYQNAPEDATFPYVTFSLASSIEDYQREIFTLNVDVWDNSEATTTLETLVGDIDGDGAISSATGLHRKHFYSANVQFDAYRATRLTIDDEDERIKRRQLVYNLYVYL